MPLTLNEPSSNRHVNAFGIIELIVIVGQTNLCIRRPLIRADPVPVPNDTELSGSLIDAIFPSAIVFAAELKNSRLLLLRRTRNVVWQMTEAKSNWARNKKSILFLCNKFAYDFPRQMSTGARAKLNAIPSSKRGCQDEFHQNRNEN